MKNKLTFITLVVFALLLISFKTKFYGYQIECVTLNSDNYIELKIWNENYKLKYKESQAQKEAIHSILYAGITSGANNCGTQPPILKNENDKQNFKKIEKKFFSKNGVWARFVKSSTLYNEASISLNKIYQIQVSKLELTKYLIEQKIIKSLNNGF